MFGKNARGTNKIMGLCLFGIFVAGFANCRIQPSLDVRIAPEVEPHPPRVGQVTITLRVTNVSGKPITAARIKVEANMSHPGMAPVFADAAEIEPGGYRANMELTMAGDWVVIADVTMTDNRKLKYQFEIKGVAPA
jgi:hypothetical protein